MRSLLVGLSCALLLGCPTEPDPPPDPAPIVDPLSRPATPTLSVDDFSGADACGECHPDQLEQWSGSAHAYAMVDPVFRALVEIRQADFDGAQDTFCVQCHSAIGTRGGEIVPGFAWDDLSDITLEGVTCEACHKVSGMQRTWNAGHELDPLGPVRGPFADPEPSAFHRTAQSDLIGRASFCGGCHDVIELSGLNLERPYAEWRTSPAAEEGRPCQSCHMPEYTGRAATTSTQDRTLRSHRFRGVEVPLLPGFVTPEREAEMLLDAQDLLGGAGSIEVEATPVTAGEQLDLLVTVKNEIDAHNLPTGSTFIRQLWVEVAVTDADGAVVYATGDLDANGDLRDAWSEADRYGDEDLLVLHSGLVDGAGNPELFPWRASEHTSLSLGPLYERTATLFVPTAPTTPGPLQVRARLRFRPFPPFLLRALGLPELVDRVPTFEIDEVDLQVPLQ